MCVWCLQYEGSVEENIVNMEAIRISATDNDKIHMENWEAVYTIISGNEAGYFNISTDPETNEGILIVKKVRQLIYTGGTTDEHIECPGKLYFTWQSSMNLTLEIVEVFIVYIRIN